MHVWPEFLLQLHSFSQQVSPVCVFERFEIVNHFAKQLVQLIQSFEKFVSLITTVQYVC